MIDRAESVSGQSPQDGGEPSSDAELERQLAAIELILALPEAEQAEAEQAFIEQRVAALAAKTEPHDHSHVTRSTHRGLLHPASEVYRNRMADPFHVDDPALYRELFQTLRWLNSSPGWEGTSVRALSIPAVQHALGRYFGNHAGEAGVEARNRAFYGEHTSASSESIHLSELQGKGFAVCAEKAAAAQNLLAFLGYDVTLIFGNDSRLTPELPAEPHVYNLFTTSRGSFLYDPTNPRVGTTENGHLQWVQPALYPLGAPEVRDLLDGRTVTVRHIDYQQQPDGTMDEKVSMRTYRGPDRRFL